MNKFTRILFFALLFLILLQLFGGEDIRRNAKDDVALSAKSKTAVGKEVVLQIENRRTETIRIENPCPLNPLLVEEYRNGEWMKKEYQAPDAGLCGGAAGRPLEIQPQKKGTLSFGLWARGLFGETGRYRITYAAQTEKKTKNYSIEIEIVPPSLFSKIWKHGLYRPIFNTLVFFIFILPGHSLGWALILLTLLIKLILLVPNQKALKSQKALQRVQPRLDALKEKHKDNPQMLAQKTMAVWKEHKVNPMGSCLPMLIQFPVLIALFYVVKDGLSLFDAQWLYAPLGAFNLREVNSLFLGLNLTQINLWVLPPAIGLLQFLQIRLSFAKSSQAAASNPNAAMMNKMMQYFLPVMIVVFAAGMPAAVGLYWGVSTLFAIGQQIVVNRSK